MKIKKSVVIIGILSFLTVCCIIFIFGNSLKDSVESTDQTMLVKDLLTDIARFFGINGEINTKKLRSFAHVAEFALLGACLAAISLFVAYKKGKLGFCTSIPFVCAAFVGGVFVAVVDEILQLFSDGRACEIKDVCLDSSGVILGIAVSCVIAFINYKIHKAREIKKGKTL